MQDPSIRDSRRLAEDDDPTPPKKEPGQPGYLERLLLESRTLLFSGPVDDKMLKDATVRILAMEEQDAEKPINVLINSPGGSADAGFAIYDLLRFVSPPINTIVNGLCASAGILIQLATSKDRRFSMAESRFMIHQPSTMGRGTASDLEITAREVLKLRDRYNRIIAEATGHSMEEVLEDARRDFWLDAGAALEYGLVSKVVTKRSEIPTA